MGKAGVSTNDVGGSVTLLSGESEKTGTGSSVANSGTLVMGTSSVPNDKSGYTGLVSLSTGKATYGNSGALHIGTGHSTSNGRSGAVSVTAGSGPLSGGALTLSAGKSGDETGGTITIISGYGAATSSGNMIMKAADAGSAGI